MYNYREAMKEDIKDYIKENYKKIPSYDDVYDELWIADGVTGNGSGSYTFCSATAKENISDNEEILQEALKEFCVDSETIADKFLNSDWEYFDVTIRCYLLGEILQEVINELKEEEEEE